MAPRRGRCGSRPASALLRTASRAVRPLSSPEAICFPPLDSPGRRSLHWRERRKTFHSALGRPKWRTPAKLQPQLASTTLGLPPRARCVSLAIGQSSTEPNRYRQLALSLFGLSPASCKPREFVTVMERPPGSPDQGGLVPAAMRCRGAHATDTNQFRYTIGMCYSGLSGAGCSITEPRHPRPTVTPPSHKTTDPKCGVCTPDQVRCPTFIFRKIILYGKSEQRLTTTARLNRLVHQFETW